MLVIDICYDTFGKQIKIQTGIKGRMWIEMKNKGNFFYKLSFHNKLFLIFLPLIFAFIIITGGACLSISSEQLKLNTEGMMENSVHQTETMIEDKLNTIHLKAVSIVDSSAFKYFVFLHKRQDPIDKEYLKNRKKLYQQLTDIAVDNAELIDSIVILEKTGKNIVYMRSPSPYVMKDTYDTLLGRLDIENENKEFYYGIGVEEEFAGVLDIKESEYVHYYPEQLCLYMCVPSRSSQILTYEVLQPAFDYMEKNNLQLAGDVISQVVSMWKPEDEYFNYHTIWIPVQ